MFLRRGQGRGRAWTERRADRHKSLDKQLLGWPSPILAFAPPPSALPCELCAESPGNQVCLKRLANKLDASRDGWELRVDRSKKFFYVILPLWLQHKAQVLWGWGYGVLAEGKVSFVQPNRNYCSIYIIVEYLTNTYFICEVFNTFVFYLYSM